MNDIIKNEWSKLKFRDYLSEFPKSKNPSETTLTPAALVKTR